MPRQNSHPRIQGFRAVTRSYVNCQHQQHFKLENAPGKLQAQEGPTAAPLAPLSMELTIAARFLLNLKGKYPPTLSASVSA